MQRTFLLLALILLIFLSIRCKKNEDTSEVPTKNLFGKEVQIGDDDIAGPFNIGFAFQFYDKQYSFFYIGANGWIGFTFNQMWLGCRNAFVIPCKTPIAPKNCILGPIQDFNPENVENECISYQTLGSCPCRKLVVTWIKCPLYWNPDSLATFQIVLNELDNSIESQLLYKPIGSDPVYRATLGIQNESGLIATSVPGKNCSSWSADREGWMFTRVSPDLYSVTSIPFVFYPSEL